MTRARWTALTSGLAAIALVMSLAGAAQAAEGDKGERKRDGDRPAKREGGPRDGRGAGLQRILGALDLDDSQKEAIRGHIAEHRKAVKEAMEGKKDEFAKLREEAQKARENKDRDAMQAVMEKRKALMADMPKPTDLIARIKSELNEDQAAKFEELAGKLREHGPRGDRPRGPRGERDGKRPERNRGDKKEDN